MASLDRSNENSIESRSDIQAFESTGKGPGGAYTYTSVENSRISEGNEKVLPVSLLEDLVSFVVGKHLCL